MNGEIQRRDVVGSDVELKLIGTVAGAMDAILAGEESVWVSLKDGVMPEDVVGLEVFARVTKDEGAV